MGLAFNSAIQYVDQLCVLVDQASRDDDCIHASHACFEGKFVSHFTGCSACNHAPNQSVKAVAHPAIILHHGDANCAGQIRSDSSKFIKPAIVFRSHCGANQAGRDQGNSFHLKSFLVVKVVTAVMRRVVEMSSAVVSFKHLGGAAVAALSSYRWGRGGPVYVPANLPVELGRVACAVRPTFFLGGYCV